MRNAVLLILIVVACGRTPLQQGDPSGVGGVADTGGAHPVSFGGVGGGIPTAQQGELVVLAYDQMDPVAIAIDDTHVYWANTWHNEGEDFCRVASVSKSGGPITVLARPFRAGGIAVAGDSVYFTSYDAGTDASPSLIRVPKRGGKAVKLSSGLLPEHIAVSGQFVYGTAEAPNVGYVPAQVPLAGGTLRPLVQTPPTQLGEAMRHAVAVDEDAVYWGTASDFAAPSTIVKVPLKGGSSQTWASVETTAYGIALDPTNVYWVTSNEVLKIPRASGLPERLAVNHGRGGFQGIAVEGKYVYWTDHGNGGSVSKVSVDGGPVTILADGLQHPAGIAVDDTSVYWANANQGTGHGYIMKLSPK